MAHSSYEVKAAVPYAVQLIVLITGLILFDNYVVGSTSLSPYALFYLLNIYYSLQTYSLKCKVAICKNSQHLSMKDCNINICCFTIFSHFGSRYLYAVLLFTRTSFQ